MNVSEKCIRTTEISKDVIINKEIDETVDAFEKQLTSKFMKLMNYSFFNHIILFQLKPNILYQALLGFYFF